MLFLLVILLLFIPLNLKVKVIFNAFENKGYVSVYFYKLKIIVKKWKFIPFKIVIQNKNKKETSIYFNKLSKNNEYKDIFSSQIIRKLHIKNFRTYANFGFNENCLITAVGVGFLKIIVGFFNCFLLNIKDASNLDSQIFCDFKKNKLFLCLTSSVHLNLFAIVSCLISSFFIKFCKGR